MTVPYSTQHVVEMTTLGSLITAHGIPRYIKIDVEGHEVHVLRGLPQPVPFVSFEAILPEFLTETRECMEMLGRLSPQGRFNYAVNCYAGLVLAAWLSGPEMGALLEGIGEKTVEVFWKSV